jgi:hypothetical protein
VFVFPGPHGEPEAGQVQPPYDGRQAVSFLFICLCAYVRACGCVGHVGVWGHPCVTVCAFCVHAFYGNILLSWYLPNEKNVFVENVSVIYYAHVCRYMAVDPKDMHTSNNNVVHWDGKVWSI